MSIQNLKFVSEATLDMLWDKVPEHLSRYADGTFEDLAVQNGWAIEAASVQIDLDAISELRRGATTPEIEVENSRLLHGALKGMTPSLAREERIWVRLTHIEGLEFARSRWLEGKSTDALEKLIREHFFGGALTTLRDSNVLARLWWNMHIAKLACPDDPEKALALILKRADIRLNFVERTRTVSRPVLAQALIRLMDEEPWVTESDDNFRALMKVMNRDGGGLLFEVRPAAELEQFMQTSFRRAQDQVAAKKLAAAA